MGSAALAPAGSHKVRVGFVGVGTCASSFVRGLFADREASGNEPVLTNVDLGGGPVSEPRLEVRDSPNSAGSAVNAVRGAKLAMDRKIGGAPTGPFGEVMKSPPQQFTDNEARERTNRFVNGDEA